MNDEIRFASLLTEFFGPKGALAFVLLGAVSYFDLRIFQHPIGHDLHRLQQRSKAADPPDGVLS